MRGGPDTLTRRTVAYIGDEPGSTAHELADQLGASHATMATLLRKNTARGVLARTEHRTTSGSVVYAYHLPGP